MGVYPQNLKGQRVRYTGTKIGSIHGVEGTVRDVSYGEDEIIVEFDGNRVYKFDQSYTSDLVFISPQNPTWSMADPSSNKDMYEYMVRLMGNYPSSSGNTPAQPAKSKYPFKKGDLVVLLSGHGKNQSKECNPIWGKQYKYITGEVAGFNGDDILIDWENGSHNAFDRDYLNKGDDDDKYNMCLFSDAPPKKERKIDLSVLDALILKDEIKTEIISVIKQMEHKDKIFTEWGLGSVIEYGKGMTFLFHGIPGTGKTWAATLIAKAIGCEVLTVGPAQIQSSEPGASNRAIQDAFKAATEEDKVLFIDECDSLIFNREQLGMILSSEVNTLLTEIEKFEGVCILATNRINEMDPALERRLALIVEFVMPTLSERDAIWKKLLPEKMPLHEEVDTKILAEHVMTGGFIKNAVLQAARLAVTEGSPHVGMDHFARAIKRVKKSNGLMGKSNNQKARVDYSQGAQVGMTTGTRDKLSSFLDSDVEKDG